MFNTKESFKKAFTKQMLDKVGRSLDDASEADVYKILSGMIREQVGSNWARTNQIYKEQKEKQVYYFSLEFLIGRLLGNNLLNLGALQIVREGLEELGFPFDAVEDEESDAGLGNGGLGRLAACFMDSLASLQYAGHGTGIRYKYGLFEQKIMNGNQVELPDYWLQKGNEWEVRRPDKQVEVRFWGHVETRVVQDRLIFETVQYETVRAVPYDLPVIGYGQHHVNTMRIWSAESTMDPLQQPYLQDGSYYRYLDYSRSVESISEFLYPDDSEYEGKLLRLKQQYFLCSAGVQSVLRTFGKLDLPLTVLPDKVAIQINDTHPTLVIPELMRILIDDNGFGWEEAWDITCKVVGYTNHTILSEALEKWPLHMVKELLPRIFMIIEEIDRRFRIELASRFPNDPDRIHRMAIMENNQIRMAHLAIAGSHSINGVAALHTDILKKREMKDFYEMYPARFNNKTNGITHRRWLMYANPELTELINRCIGTRWVKHPQEMNQLIKCSQDSSFQDEVARVKWLNKEKLANYIFAKQGIQVNPDSLFDIQVKRLHAYKRQLLNILHIMHIYNQLKDNPSMDIIPRTFIFGAKAAPSYFLAKRIIKLINTVASRINQDSSVSHLLKVVFLENYSVSLAEKIIPAADISEQISTASKEASGTGNMKFMMNGALTIGTMDGANVEMYEMLGAENMYIFGLSAEQVQNYYQYGGYSAWDMYHSDSRIHEVMNQLVEPGHFIRQRDEFRDIYQSILDHNDEYFVLKDFASYSEAHLNIDLAYRNKKEWQRKSILNIAHSGKFSSDCTIREYASEIWKLNSLQRKQPLL